MSSAAVALPIALEASLTLRWMEMAVRGGPTDADYEKARAFAQTLGEKGDVLMYGGGKKGEVASLFNQTAEALTVLSYSPGGVRFAGRTFCGRHQLIETGHVLCPKCVEETKPPRPSVRRVDARASSCTEENNQKPCQ